MTRRDALKLASAVSALGVGLGVTLEATEAEAAPAQFPATAVGLLSVKLYKERKDGEPLLVQAFELNALSHKLAKDIAGAYTIKLSNIKLEAESTKVARTELVTEQSFDLTLSAAR